MELSALVSEFARWLDIGAASLTDVVLLKLGFVALIMLLAGAIWRRLLAILRKSAEKTSSVLDDALLKAISRPVHFTIWFVGGLLVVELLAKDYVNPTWFEWIGQAGIVLLLGWFLLVFTRDYVRLRCEAVRRLDSEVDVDLYVAISRVLQAAIVIVLGIFLLQIFGVSVTGILTFGGVGGLIVGFAAKDMLENFFGGLMLHMDRPFKTGDWIRSPDRALEGTVERIGWRQTLIRTHSRNALYIPNGMFLTIIIENPGRMTHRMIKETIGLRYDDLGRVQPIVAEVQKHLENSPDFDPEMPMLVRFDAFSESSLDFYVQCYTREVNRAQYSAIKQKLLLDVAGIVEQHGAEMAFPTRTVHLQSESS